MNASVFKTILMYIFGGTNGIVTYLLDVVNNALAQIEPDKRAKTAAVYNVIKKAIAILNAFKFLCPTKWQNAYEKTQYAVYKCVQAIEDFEITPEELSNVRTCLGVAYKSWCEDDDILVDNDLDTYNKRANEVEKDEFK